MTRCEFCKHTISLRLGTEFEFWQQGAYPNGDHGTVLVHYKCDYPMASILTLRGLRWRKRYRVKITELNPTGLLIPETQ